MKLRGKAVNSFPTSSFSSVMGMGIVSDAFFQLGITVLSNILVIMDTVLYLALVCFFLFLLSDRLKEIINKKLDHISVLGSFSFVAGTAVLVTRLSESGFFFLDIPALVVCVVSIILLVVLLIFRVDHGIFSRLDKPYLILIPFIALFSTSVLSAQSFLKLDVPRQYLFQISISTWFLALAGTLIFLPYTLFRYRKNFRHPETVDGFYMIYSGIASLLSFSGLTMVELFKLSNIFLLSFLRVIIIMAYGWAVISTAPLFYIYARKLKEGSLKPRHKVSIWGSVFPMGVDSMGSFFVSSYFHLYQLIYLAYAYAFIGLTLILVDIIGIVSLIRNKDLAIENSG